LIQLDPSASTADIQKKARTRSLRLIPLHALPAGHLNEGLERADGIIFERLKIALVNERNAASLQQLQALRNTPFLSSEPERYIYARAGARRELPFKDTAAATWGIQAVNARKSKFTGKDVKLAILDTGFDFTHPDFMGRVIHRKSFVGRQAKDREGHGTHCAGIAGGGRKGKAGVRYGVAPGSRLYIGKILNDQGEGSDGLALAGIEWALEQGCRVISMSFGAQVQKGDKHSVIFEEVAKIALANNCLLIGATGNESDREEGIIAPVNHPANCPSVMAVGALTEHLKISNYSCANVGRSGGQHTRSGGQVDIAAPGDDIFSAWIDGGHEVESGTSMAAPFVAGVAALLWEEHPDVSAREIWEKLIGQVRKLGLRTVGAGAGLVYVP
jgi:subtilisin family serine protease